jgi:hypothetical protein
MNFDIFDGPRRPAAFERLNAGNATFVTLASDSAANDSAANDSAANDSAANDR